MGRSGRSSGYGRERRRVQSENEDGDCDCDFGFGEVVVVIVRLECSRGCGGRRALMRRCAEERRGVLGRPYRRRDDIEGGIGLGIYRVVYMYLGRQLQRK